MPRERRKWTEVEDGILRDAVLKGAPPPPPTPSVCPPTTNNHRRRRSLRLAPDRVVHPRAHKQRLPQALALQGRGHGEQGPVGSRGGRAAVGGGSGARESVCVCVCAGGRERCRLSADGTQVGAGVAGREDAEWGS